MGDRWGTGGSKARLHAEALFANAASRFLGPKLQTESRADVAWEGATADNGVIGGSMGGRRQQSEVVRGDGIGGTGAASCFPGLEL